MDTPYHFFVCYEWIPLIISLCVMDGPHIQFLISVVILDKLISLRTCIGLILPFQIHGLKALILYQRKETQVKA